MIHLFQLFIRKNVIIVQTIFYYFLLLFYSIKNIIFISIIIEYRLAALKKNNEEGWKKRVDKQNLPDDKISSRNSRK